VIFSVIVYDENDARVGVLKDATRPRYSRSKNAADQVSFSIPRNDSVIRVGDSGTLDSTYLTMDLETIRMDATVRLYGASDPLVIRTGRRFEIVRSVIGEPLRVECSGYITEHGYSDDEYVVSGMTEEVLLSRYLTPAQFGYPLYSENATIDDLARELGKTYITEQVKWAWADYLVDSAYIDYTTNPTFMLLQNLNPGGEAEYVTSGYAVFRFQKAADEEWERFRWVGDYYSGDQGEVKIEVSYRQADTVGGLGSFTTPVPGALTDVVGIVLASQSLTYTEVRVDFTTTTTDISPVLFSLEMIKRKQDKIHTVTIVGDASSLVTPGLEADQATFLDVLISALEPHDWEFQVSNGTLTISETFGTSRTNEYAVVAV
jgi:hypothetical protein